MNDAYKRITGELLKAEGNLYEITELLDPEDGEGVLLTEIVLQSVNVGLSSVIKKLKNSKQR